MTYRFRIESIAFNDGTHVEPGPLTVFIGPNNVGKSRILNDIAGQTAGSLSPPVIVKRTNLRLPERLQDLTDTPHDLAFKPADDGYVWHDLSLNLCSGQQGKIPGRFPDDFDFLFDTTTTAADRYDSFCHHFGGRLVAHLTTETRLNLVKRVGARGYNQPSQGLLHLLMYESAPVLEEVARTFRDAFRQELFLDYSALSQLSLRVLREPRPLPAHPRDLHEALRGEAHLDEQGDGMRAFAGIATALAVIGRPVVLIDEPETFLHPPQSRAVGKLIARAGSDDRQMIVATHSVDVLRGLLTANRPTRILRLTRDGNTNALQELDPSLLKEIASDPLKSSARVLDGLFYQSVAVVEGESDARFLGVVADRMGGDHVHFVSAGGKQATSRIVEMYRRLGVRCASVLDFDALRDPTELRAYLDAHGIHDRAAVLELQGQLSQRASNIESREHRIAHLRTHLTALLELSETGDHVLAELQRRIPKLQRIVDPWADLKRGGLQALDQPQRRATSDMLEALAANGLFINPAGELEALLPDDLEVGELNKAAWVRRAVPLAARMEPDPTTNPWQFMRKVLDYLEDSKG